MMNVGEWIYNLFGSDGAWGLILVVFFIFLLDAFLVPTLPELFFVLAFMGNEGGAYGSSAVWGGELLLAAILAEVVGITSLYLVVRCLKVPRRIEKAVRGYADFLVMGDERLLLLNRVAPMIPFAGAFIAIAGWDIRKSLFYILIGCILKYGFIAILADFFMDWFSSDVAQTFTLIMIFAVIGVSVLLSTVMKKRRRKADDSFDDEAARERFSMHYR